MAPRKKRSRRPDSVIESYRRIRKPMPPPERVIPDKRQRDTERQAEREARDETP